MKLAVILFAYKRQKTLKKVLRTHYKIDADYFCFVDYSEIQDEVYQIVDSKKLYTIYKKESNELSGASKLNSNITTGITEIFKRGYDACIILEDDILIKIGGLEWLKEQLMIYKQTESIGAISLDKGMIETFKCWGWGTWKDRWQSIDWNLEPYGKYAKGWNKTKSWDYYVAFWFDAQGLSTRCHPRGLSKHIGYFGTHFKWYSHFSVRKIIKKVKTDFSTWNYYKDKDLLMRKETLREKIYRLMK